MASSTSNVRLFITDIANQVKDLVDHLRHNFTVIDRLYHVGRVIITADADFDPNDEFAGTRWVRIQDAFLVGAGGDHPVGSTGGTATHFHRSSVGFDGKQFFGYLGRGGDAQEGIPYWGSEVVSNRNSLQTSTSAAFVNRERDLRVSYTEPVSSLPPYEAVYIWKRTA